MKKKITRRDFAVFKKWCEYYIKLFGVTGIKVFIEFEPIDNPDTIAENTYNHTNSDITLNKTHNCAAPLALRKTALHEVLHVVISPLHLAAMERYVTESEVQNTQERVTRTLTNVITELENP